MHLISIIIVFSIKSLVVLNKSNPKCFPDFTIDSAFVDKYSDLGSDVIILFADNTVYKLSVNATNPMNPIFIYKGSEPLNEWSKGVIGPINTVFYDYSSRGKKLTLQNIQRSYEWVLWSHNKTIVSESPIDSIDIKNYYTLRPIKLEILVLQPFEYISSSLHHDLYFTFTTVYQLKGSAVTTHDGYQMMSKLQNISDNPFPIDQIRNYLSQTTAGFAFNDYLYLFVDNRVCRLNNKTLHFDDNCMNQTIAELILCEDMAEDKTPAIKWIIVVILIVLSVIIIGVIIALIACEKFEMLAIVRKTDPQFTATQSESMNTSTDLLLKTKPMTK